MGTEGLGETSDEMKNVVEKALLPRLLSGMKDGSTGHLPLHGWEPKIRE